MESQERFTSARLVVVLVSLCIVSSAGGCAAVIRGTTQTVTVVTNPPGRTIRYQGMPVKDGESISIQKRLDPAKFDVGRDGRPVLVDVQYDVDPLVVVDAVLIIPFLVPGLVALGVDLGTDRARSGSVGIEPGG